MEIENPISIVIIINYSKHSGHSRQLTSKGHIRDGAPLPLVGKACLGMHSAFLGSDNLLFARPMTQLGDTEEPMLIPVALCTSLMARRDHEEPAVEWCVVTLHLQIVDQVFVNTCRQMPGEYCKWIY